MIRKPRKWRGYEDEHRHNEQCADKEELRDLTRDEASIELSLKADSLEAQLAALLFLWEGGDKNGRQ